MEHRGCGKRKLSPARALKIIELHDCHGVENLALAERFGVSVTAIRNVLCGRSYSHVTGRVHIPRSDSRRRAGGRPPSMSKMRAWGSQTFFTTRTHAAHAHVLPSP